MIKTNIINIPPYSFRGKYLIKKLARMVKKKEGIKRKHVISIIFVEDEEIQKINKQYRGIDIPTDVISFAEIDDSGSELPYELGDIFINTLRVKSQAEEYGHSEKRELAFLILHGMLHLLGYDHMNKEDEQVMFKRQEEILNRLKIERN